MPSESQDDASDAELVKRTLAGDKSAFAVLFTRYNLLICTYLMYLVNDDQVKQDLAQNTFITAYEKLGHLRDGSTFKSWICKIARNQAYDYLRRRQRNPEQSLDGLDFLWGEFEDPVVERELISLALAQVSPIYRECLFLLVQGFSRREIAQMLKLNEKSVSTYLSNAREQFRRAHRRLQGLADDTRRRLGL